jgi:hypothetical protein
MKRAPAPYFSNSVTTGALIWPSFVRALKRADLDSQAAR